MSQIKVFALIPMREGISRQTFHDHWRHPHGTWARGISTSTRYVQSHRIETALLGPEQARFEGIAEVWMETIEDARARRQDPYYEKYILPDEPNFVDRSALRFVLTEEEVIQSGAPPGTHADSADARWKARDAALAVKLIQVIEQDGATPWAAADDKELGYQLRALRHVRSRPYRELHPGGEPPPAAIGFRELWWPTLSAFEAAAARAPDALRTLLKRPAKAFAMLAQAERVI